ncbi:TPA: hypothetical protein N0F65_009650 [Lagenidium giganteum]|uniref:Calponin-homology (CH) domain-containing protein n=1 Tax=Lagenidium giganteum TaxID=4803 RepID=A0AAV2YKV7_9STRA|nr:TPA: hypothetical protein N0F65_009650 [Lagenidium giganteum]
MELELVLPSPEMDAGSSEGLASPKYGKHREFSASAKWANNKALALEYLKRQREIMLWIESVLDRKIGNTDLFDALRSGIILRELLMRLYPEPAEGLSPISRNYSVRMAPWKERENITVFLKQCKALGMNDCSMFCTDDLYEGTNMVQVLFGLQHFIYFSEERSTHCFKPIQSEPVSFSNQEVEMALSKIEMAGSESTSLKDLITAASQSETNLLADYDSTDDGRYSTSASSSELACDEESKIDAKMYGKETIKAEEGVPQEPADDEESQVAAELNALEQELEASASLGASNQHDDPQLDDFEEVKCALEDVVLQVIEIARSEAESAGIDLHSSDLTDLVKEVDIVMDIPSDPTELAISAELETPQTCEQATTELPSEPTELIIGDMQTELVISLSEARIDSESSEKNDTSEQRSEKSSAEDAEREQKVSNAFQDEPITKVGDARVGEKSKAKKHELTAEQRIEDEAMSGCACGRGGCSVM